MRPDLAEVRHFGTIYVVILSVFKYLEPSWENLEPTLANLYATGQIKLEHVKQII